MVQNFPPFQQLVSESAHQVHFMVYTSALGERFFLILLNKLRSMKASYN